MKKDPQIRERLDAGDVHGAVKLILKRAVSDAKKGIPLQNTETLDVERERAMNEFFGRHPELSPESEQAAAEFGFRVGFAVRKLNLDGTDVEHWEAGFKLAEANDASVRPRQATPTVVPPPAPPAPADELTQAAQNLIVRYGGTHGFKSHFDGLTAKQMEHEMLSRAFQLAVELCFPSSTPSILTRGDFVSAAQAVRVAEISGTDPRAVESAIAKSRDLHAQAYANYRERPEGPEGGKPHWGPSFGNRQNAQSGRRMMTAEEARANEQANVARCRQPEKPRADAVREEQEREAKEKRDRWNR